MNIIFTKRKTKRISRILLAVWVINMLQPLGAYALTSGPGQPESQSFQPAGVSDMVDLVSGDFKYNIPLMDVDGYPLNLNYQSGVGIDDEASWVGLGWNLNVGSISRQMRGIPDDFAGDEILTEHYTKPKITVGGRLTAKVEVRGKAKSITSTAPIGGTTPGNGLVPKVSGSFMYGIFSDNYTGIGAEVGVNAGISFTQANDGLLTAGLGIGILSSTASGVDVTPNVSLSISENSKNKQLVNSGLSSSFGYNTRSGMKTLGFAGTCKFFDTGFPSISFNTDAISPKVQIPYKSSYGSFSIDAGVTAGIVFLGGGGTGYLSVREVAQKVITSPAYGFLYADRGKNKSGAIMDFIREKENPVIPELPNLALPVHTPDIFTYNSQNGSGQFRLFRGGTGAFFDNEVTDKSSVLSLGGDIGFGGYLHVGVTLFNQSAKTTTRKWSAQNDYLRTCDFQNEPTADPTKQHVFFKSSSEKNVEDAAMAGKLFDNSLLTVTTQGRFANSSFIVQNGSSSNVANFTTPVQKESREVQNTMISYLTSAEAAVAGLNKMIYSYGFNLYGSFQPPANHVPIITDSVNISNNSIKRKHHISEITVNSGNGQRTVYGLPVYNLLQDEYSFALGSGYENKDGLAAISVNGIERNKGIDHYYHKESQPAYAYSYLLTGILSPDYMDKTGNGISDDDNGTAIKFNYSKIDKYKWRTPYKNKLNDENVKNTASLNRGLLADPDDDKGSIIYGEKEIYYAHSIESKTKIAYFITEDRQDGLGVQDINGTPDPTVRQKCLREIRLYSKENMTKPIKVVKFEYTYELCPGTPNSIAPAVPGHTAEHGKLTLKKVWFEYGLTHKGANHPYMFNYNKTYNGTIVSYGTQQTDRWGTYKAPANNPGGLSNEEYPYARQNKIEADSAAKLWHIQSVELPSGGKIDVDYEADDYAYVQNKHAMEMVPFTMLGTGGSLIDTFGIQVPIDVVPPASATNITSWFKDTYLNGSDYIYTKSLVKISTDNAPSVGHDDDFVPSYCKIASVTIIDGKANIMFEQVDAGGIRINPIRFAAWQRLKNEYPRYAYPGFENRTDHQSGLSATVNAIISAAGNLSELKENFYKKANRKRYAEFIKDDGKSFAKIVKTSGYKIGGGVRVKKIRIKDLWYNATGLSPEATYGQSYDYRTMDNGKLISSGVAANEPSIGNDESALKQPVPYVQRIKGAINNYFELEEPFGESFYPAPSIAYSKVTVRDLEAEGNEVDYPKTGYTVSEYYTAKDFPVRVKFSDTHPYNPSPSSFYSLVMTQSIDEMVLSQGYVIEVNDMHGKPKANRVFNQSGSEISSTEYFYQVDNPNATEPKLNNTVNIIDQKGFITPKVMGRDIEFFTDFREQETTNTGVAVNVGFDLSLSFIGFPIPLPHFPVNVNDEYKLFRSACAVKVIQSSGIVSKVIKTENGSSIAVENVAYDGITGEAVITKTQNEFKKYYYTTNIPAYWAYRKMGGAYQNLGMILKNVSLSSNYEINSSYWNLLTQGDELVNLGTGEHYWVVDNRSEVTSGQTTTVLDYEPTKILINRAGEKLTTVNANNNVFKVVRSGFRNLLSENTENIVSLNSPLKNDRLVFASRNDSVVTKVINASLTTYDDEWPVDGKGQINTRDENTTKTFTYTSSGSHQFHGDSGCRFYNPYYEETYRGTESSTTPATAYPGYPYYYFQSNLLNRRMDQVGIWVNTAISNVLDQAVGVSSSFTATVSKTYYIGFSGDDKLKITIDGQPIIQPEDNNVRYWSIHPIFLSAANTHSIEIEGYNISNANNTLADNPASLGVEIYDNTIDQLIAATSPGDLNTIFRTSDLLSVTDLQSFRTIDGIKTWRFTYNSFYNPFVQGLKGNWRPYSQKVYQTNRSYSDILTANKKGVDVVNSGYMDFFKSYWSYTKEIDSSAFYEWFPNTLANKWTTVNYVKQYDKYGQEKENIDALDRYSAANFDFKGQLPAAVASNARNREIYTNSFEDKNRIQSLPDTSVTREFIASPNQPLLAYINSTYSHTGVYSLALPVNGITLATKKHSLDQKTFPYLSRNTKNEFTLISKTGLYPRGFEPVSNGAYVFSLWVKDNQPENKTVNITVNQSGLNTAIAPVVSMNCKAVVEGWKLLEGTIEPNSILGEIWTLSVKANSAGIYIDDIRIHPKNSHLKSYVYDYRNFKLMAEMDENAFATLYEYDDEGSLVRVKKETERGIVTIKENRSSYRQRLSSIE